MRGARAVLAALVALAGCAAPPPAAAPPAAAAGFQRLRTASGLDVAVWFPAIGAAVPEPLGPRLQAIVPGAAVPAAPPRRPLVVISHGTGGTLSDHMDVALTLARAGFVVAALNHPGDTLGDHRFRTAVERRAPALSALVTFMLSAWAGRASIDPARIGAFGFSAGGFTVLVAAGGRPDLGRIGAQCARHPARYDCAVAAAHLPGSARQFPAERDGRIRAAVVAAPGLGYLFDRWTLADVTVPLQLWRADADRVVSGPFSVDAVRAALPLPPEFHPVPGAGHLDFVAPCTDPAARPRSCTPRPGFDRVAFHRQFDAAVLAFFRRTLGATAS